MSLIHLLFTFTFGSHTESASQWLISEVHFQFSNPLHDFSQIFGLEVDFCSFARNEPKDQFHCQLGNLLLGVVSRSIKGSIVGACITKIDHVTSEEKKNRIFFSAAELFGKFGNPQNFLRKVSEVIQYLR